MVTAVPWLLGLGVMLAARGGIDDEGGGDSAYPRIAAWLVRALGRGLCSAVALATWWTPHAGEVAPRMPCSGACSRATLIRMAADATAVSADCRARARDLVTGV